LKTTSFKPFFFFILRLGVCATSNYAYSGYPELWILRYPAHRYRTAPCLRRDLNPRPFGWESDVLTIRPRRSTFKPWPCSTSIF
jgi:hypothetical protein